MQQIHPTATLDHPFRSFQGCKPPYSIEYRETILAENLYIGPGAIIGRGAELHEGVVIDAHCIVDPNAVIGPNTLVTYRAIVGGEVEIGSDCVIGGFISEGCSIGNHCRVFGRLIHRHLDLSQPWDEHDEEEPSPIVSDYSFIGMGAIVLGGVQIGPRAYVTAGAIVSRDVPPDHIATATNRVFPARRWPGKLV